MKVLLTGAGGFVGHHTLEHILKTTDWEVVCLDSFRHKGMSSRLRDIFAINESARSRVSVITHDLRSPIDHITAKEIGHIDAIINMASESHVDRSLIYPRQFINNNVELCLNMLEYAREIDNLSLFIQISTDEVYGPARHGDHPEYDPILPSNPYSASKAAQEAIAIAYWRSYNVPVVLSNTMNIFGERQDPEKFIPKAIKCLRSGNRMPVHGSIENGKWQSGSRFYLHARNQADALVYILNNYKNHPIKFLDGIERPHRFHVGGEVEVSNDDMVKMIATHMGLEGDWIQKEDVGFTRPGHDLRYGLERKTLEEWGWVSPVSFNKSLEKTVKWTLENPDWLK